MGSWTLVWVPILLQSCTQVSGHGNMVFPMTWWDKDQLGWYFNKDGVWGKLGCGVLDLPEDTEYQENHGGHKPDCMQMWFSHGTKIPGSASIPDDLSQADLDCNGKSQSFVTHSPWNAPGTAPVFGPCGTLGANPFGCIDQGEHDGEHEFGDCCNQDCSHGFANGDNAENYEWENPPVTEWKAGSYQEVAWFVAANHAGGYAYRICKIPDGGISKLTEDCFQENHLDFAGEEQWVEYQANRTTGQRTELKALQTTEGTFPPGSMWRANPLHPDEGSDYARGHIIDNLKVPANLETGDYVLSFRWDCKCTQQVWGSCANIKIV